jgi:hypothetical protein
VRLEFTVHFQRPSTTYVPTNTVSYLPHVLRAVHGAHQGSRDVIARG